MKQYSFFYQYTRKNTILSNISSKNTLIDSQLLQCTILINHHNIVCKYKNKSINVQFVLITNSSSFQSYLNSFHPKERLHFFFLLSSIEWIISMESWITLSVPTVIQLFIEMIHSIDEFSSHFFDNKWTIFTLEQKE